MQRPRDRRGRDVGGGGVPSLSTAGTQASLGQPSMTLATESHPWST